jgi:pilus assembly protein CpaB
LINRNLLLGLGVLALLSGALLAFMWFRQPETPVVPVATKIPTTFILVAARAMPAATLILLRDIAWAEVPAADATSTDIPRGEPAIANVKDDTVLGAYVGAVTRRAFAANAPLTSDGLVRPGDPDFLGAALRPGYRAVSISVDAAQSTSGLVVPGDRVDIILTQSFQVQANDPGHRSVGETVLHDLRVIAVDQTLGPAPKPATPPTVGADTRLPKTVTLEVTQEQAEKLLVAEQLGKIQLSLLGEADQNAAPSKESAPVRPVWASDVSPALLAPLMQAAPLPEAAPLVSETRTSVGPISVMHGAKTERVCVTSAGLATCP